MQEQQTQSKSIFDALSPKQTFFAGAIGGFLVLCTIGFFILLSIFLGGDGVTPRSANGSGSGADSGRVVQPSQPSDSGHAMGGSGDVQVAAVDPDNDHIRGNEDAEISIIEFSDLECPFCSRFHTTMQQVIDTYGDDVRWVYRHFPLTSIHPNATLAAEASECAGEQGKFWEFTDLIFERQASGVNATTLAAMASDVGLNVGQYTTCVETNKYADVVAADARDAQVSGGRGTPHSIIVGPNGETSVLSGAQPFSAVEAAIQQYL